MKGNLPGDYEPCLKNHYCERGPIKLRSMVEIQAKDVNPGRVCNKYAKIPASQIQQHRNRVIYQDQMRFS